MSLQETEATPDAVDFVLANLWDRGREELKILGIEPEVARSIIARQRDQGMPSIALWCEGTPVVICGLMAMDEPGGMRTWFQATEQFGYCAGEITRYLREALQARADAYNLDFIEIVSPCVHPRTGRWFGALGFTLDANRYIPDRDGTGRLYRFERRFSRRQE